jgi:hypothetical protein
MGEEQEIEPYLDQNEEREISLFSVRILPATTEGK